MLLAQMKGCSLIFIINIPQEKKEEEGRWGKGWMNMREMRDREMETNVCENTGPDSEAYQLQISN